MELNSAEHQLAQLRRRNGFATVGVGGEHFNLLQHQPSGIHLQLVIHKLLILVIATNL